MIDCTHLNLALLQARHTTVRWKPSRSVALLVKGCWRCASAVSACFPMYLAVRAKALGAEWPISGHVGSYCMYLSCHFLRPLSVKVCIMRSITLMGCW